jgi:hypothetical protein
MKSPHNNPSNETPASAEETLRMVAQLPAPDGLSARVQASLRTAPQPTGSTFSGVFGFSGWMHSTAMRTAAAAAIVCAVTGGGWQIYSHVQTSPAMQGVAVPARVDNGQGGFSTSGAIAKPDPLKAPVITHQVRTKQQDALRTEKKPAQKKGSEMRTPATDRQR